MKKKIFLAILGLLSLNSCKGQDKDQIEKNPDIQPKENVIVNKEYDENGNLIRYDSTYTYVYSNFDGDFAKRDSIFNSFRQRFNEVYDFSEDPFFEDLFFQDSLLQYDFYKDDFFLKRFQQNMKMMEQLFREMDSVKNQFYRDQWIEEKNKQKKA